ncbi:MAG: hypothetical protein P8077_05760 [Gammaproteobacteria bacterium]
MSDADGGTGFEVNDDAFRYDYTVHISTECGINGFPASVTG